MMEGGDLRSTYPGEQYGGFVNQQQQQQQQGQGRPNLPYYEYNHHPNHPQPQQQYHHQQSPNEFPIIKENWDIRELAAIFLKSYYQLWETGPQYLYRFHGEDTDFTHGEGRTVTGLEQIKIRLAELNYHNTIAEINYYDAFEAVNKSISIVIVGKMTCYEGPWRPFIQMLVLNLVTLSSRKYYVRTDLFKYLDSIFPHDFLNPSSTSALSPPSMYNYQQQPPQHHPKYQQCPYIPCPFAYHPSSMYLPETLPPGFVPYAAYGQIPPHLYQAQPQQLHTAPPYPFPAVSLSGRDLHLRHELSIPLLAHHPGVSVSVIEENKNVEQNDIININDENREIIEQQNMNSMIHTNNNNNDNNNNDDDNDNEVAAVSFKQDQDEVFSEKGPRQSPEQEEEVSFQNRNRRSPSLKPNSIMRQSSPILVYQNEFMNLSKASISSISSTSLPSMASPTFNLTNSPPPLPIPLPPSPEPKIMDKKEIVPVVPVSSIIIENSNTKIEQQKQHSKDKDDKVVVKAEVEKKQELKLIPLPETPPKPNNVTKVKEQKNNVDDKNKDQLLLAEAFPLYDGKSKQQSGSDYKYNTTTTSLAKKSVLSYKDKVLAPAVPAPPLPPRPVVVSKPQSQFLSTVVATSSSIVKIKASTSRVVSSGSGSGSTSSVGFTNRSSNTNNNQNNVKNQRNNSVSGGNQRNFNGNQRTNYNGNGNQRNNYNNNNNGSNYQKNNCSNNSGNNIEKKSEEKLSFKPAKNEDEALEMIYSYPDKYQLFVGNLPTHINDDDISKLFSPFGEIIAIKIKKPHQNHAPSTPFCAFLVFKSEDAVQAVLKAIEEKHMFMPLGEGRDRRLNIEAKQTRPRQFTPHTRPPYQQTTWKRRTDYGNNNNNRNDNNQQQQRPKESKE